MSVLAYTRTSTSRQTDAAQRQAIWSSGAFPDQWCSDQAISRNVPLWERPQGQQLVRSLGTGDEVLVYSADRFGSGVSGVQAVTRVFNRGATLRSLREPKATMIKDWEVLFQAAASDVSNTSESIRLGLEAARLRGTHIGRPYVNIPNQEMAEIREKRATGVTLRQLAIEYGVSRGTLRRRLAQPLSTVVVANVTPPLGPKCLALRDIMSSPVSGGWLVSRMDAAGLWEVRRRTVRNMTARTFGGADIREIVSEGDVVEIHTEYLGAGGKGYMRVLVTALVYRQGNPKGQPLTDMEIIYEPTQ